MIFSIFFNFFFQTKKYMESSPIKIVQIGANFLKNPYYISIFSLCFLSAFQLGIIFAIQYHSPIALILLRGGFGFFDAVHRCKKKKKQISIHFILF